MDCIERLVDEHRKIVRAIEMLEASTNRVSASEDVPIAGLLTLTRFFHAYADEIHHAKEEDLLFVAMREAGFPSDAGPVAVMLREHDVGRAHVEAMRSALEAGLEGDAGKRFVENALGFARLLRAHIQKENEILYPMARQALRGEAWAKLEAQIAAADDRDAAASAQWLEALDQLDV